MPERPTRQTHDRAESDVESIHVSATVFIGGPATIIPTTESPQSKSRPVKGKYADVPYSSEDLIRDKKAEVELEDR